VGGVRPGTGLRGRIEEDSSVNHRCALRTPARPGGAIQGVAAAVLAAFGLGGPVSPAAGQVRIVSYNVAQLLGNDATLQAVLTAAHADDKPGFAVPVTVFLFQEVRSTDLIALQSLVDAAAPPGVSYSRGTFTSAPGEDDFGGAQAMFYRSNTVVEVAASHTDIYSGAGRYADRWQIRLLNYPSTISFFLYSMHLKAGSAPADEADRLIGAQNVRASADELGPGEAIIYAGDFNASSSTDDGYQHLISPGSSQGFDPLGSGSWGGMTNAFKHTQSPREVAFGGLIGGGMNDRFDFQLSTLALQDGFGLAIIPGTYRAFGNDGQHYNIALNSGNNFYYPADIPRSNALADDLHDASDHVPVIADYQVPALISAFVPGALGRLITGAVHSALAIVSNIAPVTVPEGADLLDIDASASGALSGTWVTSLEALQPAALHSFPVNTAAVGPVAGTITILHNSEGIAGNQSQFNVSGTVIRHSNPSFSAGMDQNERLVKLEAEPETGVHAIAVDVHNLGYDALQAGLDIDAVVGASAPFAYLGGAAMNIGASPATLMFSLNTSGLAVGVYGAAVTVQTSDENLPGATSAAITLNLQAIIGSPAACPADCAAPPDGFINVSDLLVLLAQWGGGGTCDVTGNGSVDVSDLLELLAAWGACP
jgi:endonuclease/exonuclease/phosphatase family metal-dependent hydrolase